MRWRSRGDDVEQLRRFWDLSTDLFSIVGFDGACRRVNDAVTQLVGYQPEELLSMRLVDLVHADDRAFAEEVLATVANGEPRSGEARIVCKDGTSRSLEFSAISEPDRQLIYVAARDATERRHQLDALRSAEGDLRAAEAKYRNLVERLPLVIFMDRLDEVSSNIYTSPQTLWMLGYTAEEWVHDPDLFVKVIHPEDRDRVVREMTGPRPEPYLVEYRMIRPDGRVVWVRDESFVIRDDDGTPLYGLGYLMDITAQKEAESESRRLEEALRQAQKMEAVGRLAGGIAHDFNSLLTAILGYVDLARSADDLDEAQTNLDQIGRAAERAADLTRQLLAFGRKQMLEPRIVDLNDVVRSAEELLRRLAGDRVRFRLELAPSLPPVRADPGQIEHVLANLAVNARDAIPGIGELTIATAAVELADADAPAYELEPGGYVAIRVRDTGVGMDESTLARAFEPFFTTKELGEGTGLGLATVYGIVRQSRGGIAATSEPGRGTTFTVMLPRVREPDAASPPGLPRGSERVLVVEDEPALRRLVCTALERQGYELVSAQSAGEALECFGTGGDEIDLLVTALALPGMPGRELAEKLAAAHPALRVLYTIGYTDDPSIARDADHNPLLERPFGAGDVIRKVREVLDA